MKGKGSLTTWNDKAKFDVSSEGPSSGVSSGGRGKTTRVFIRVNTKTSRDKIKANQMDFIKTKCKQRNVNHIAKYRNEGLTKAKVSHKDRWALNVTETFINAKRVDSAKFGNEAHFMSFAAIIATRNGTEGSNFHIRNTMTAIVEVSGNRLVCIVACDRATVLAKPSPQTSSSFSNVKHATSTTWYTVDEMGRGAREMVLDVVNKFRCRNSGRGIYKLASFTLAHSTRESATRWRQFLGQVAMD